MDTATNSDMLGELDEEGLARELAPVFVELLRKYDVNFDLVMPLLTLFAEELALTRRLSAVSFAVHFARAAEATDGDGRASSAARALLRAVRASAHA